MKHNAIRKLEGYMVYNRYMPTSVEMFFSGNHDTHKEGCPENNKELCEKYIRKHHYNHKIDCVKATLYYEVPEDVIFCRKNNKCTDGICFCDEPMTN